MAVLLGSGLPGLLQPCVTLHITLQYGTERQWISVVSPTGDGVSKQLPFVVLYSVFAGCQIPYPKREFLNEDEPEEKTEKVIIVFEHSEQFSRTKKSHFPQTWPAAWFNAGG